VRVLGALRRDDGVSAPERHLGLVPAGEHAARAAAAIEALAGAIDAYVDLEAVMALARSAPALDGPAWSPDCAERVVARVAVAGGPAFSFHYEENLELLRAAGAELLPFDPLHDESLPDGCGALLLAGGFPEVYASELSANTGLRAQVRSFAAAGGVVLAECGGLLYLLESLDGHEMCGVVPGRGAMSGRLSLGYREAVAATSVPWMDAGELVRGHEFHYSTVEPAPSAPAVGSAPAPAPAWTLRARGVERRDGFALGAIQAGYLHVHWAAFPGVARRLVRAAASAPTPAPESAHTRVPA
jgi:cobyrinic acid a,c-diamide synthase